jgi:outer membrane protein OmpA-like peptidoglycan-associated protein
MKKLSIVLFFTLFSLYTLAQDALFEDTFDKKNETWKFIDNHADKVVENGNLILLGNFNKDVVYAIRDIVIDPSRDYSISCRIRYSQGFTEKSFGLVAFDGRFSDKPIYYYFMLYPKDCYQISTSKAISSRFSKYLPKQKNTGIVRTSGDYNDLELKNSGGTLAYFINGQKVWSKSNSDICISQIGLFTEGFQEVKADDLVIKQDGWRQVNLVDSSFKANKKENLGENVNSASSEFAPIISADGQTLYLCVEFDKANTGADDAQDIWYSTLNPDSTWSKRVNIGFPLNDVTANGVSYVSPDKNTLLVDNRYDKSGNTIGEGFSISNRTKSGWSIPVAMEIDNYYNKNQYYSVTYSPSGNVLIMSIERDDTYGEKDLYVSFKKEDGSWSEPLNMGLDINTYGVEATPFLAADNTTLYFSTNARPGYGYYDIFMTRRMDDTWTKWSEPFNLGPSINTPGWDGYFTIPASGDYAYLVSTENSFGYGDIFRVKVSEASKPKPVALIKGQVYNLKTSEFLEASITYFDLETNREIGTASSNPNDGAYKISLPAGHKYSYFAKKDGYFSVSENIDLTGMGTYTEITRDLYLAPIEVGQSVRLNNIFFDYDKSDILGGSVYELDRLVKSMNENPNIVIQISGHTDNLGTEAYNQKLSEDRARAVYMYIISKNISTVRVSSVGYGESRPIASNDTEEGRALNRRVEFVIISK